MVAPAHDISPKFKWNPYDSKVASQLIKLDGTPEAIKYFAEVCEGLTDYGYWFFLSTLWVSYTGWSDINLWCRLFSSDRPGRKKSIMKPSELDVFDKLPYFITAYRAHRPDETDWIAYTLDPVIAARFARERGVNTVKEYQVKTRDVIGLFLRRGEQEIIVLDKDSVRLIQEIEVIIRED